ncbi:hypothetical protein [Streptomyces sp. WAC06614]|uniref:hypothetical protein n=1 Tax=Streptomyces sp. WAC06614 TaxID=2487416 RepID=UPI000F7B0BC8|nr:hypothetical protein [Streptomyces sp. WAC06614]RSS83748.1 hypothetical protein EF918_02785 [Streptomyces sp. WAC06614]
MLTPLKSRDENVRRILASVEVQVGAMYTAAGKVEAVVEEIRTHFVAACSATYTTRIDDWQTKYAQVKETYQRFHDTLSEGHRGLDTAHGDAQQMASGWGSGSDAVYGALHPTR